MLKKSARYTGKAKTLYDCDDSDHLICEFRDDTTAFNGIKSASLVNKGRVNNFFNAYIMEVLAEHGLATHFVKLLDDNESLVKRLDMIPVECVVRNRAAGGICKRLGLNEGIELAPPTFEFFLKNDELGDPMINEFHIRTFGWASDTEVARMKELTFQINTILAKLFADNEMILVDYKLEFGRLGNDVVLGDEFTPDGCRIWDTNTMEKLDKDRFRNDMGDVVESYQLVAERLGIDLAVA